MKADSIVKVYIDTNVLVNYVTGQHEDVSVMNYLFKVRRKETLFTSSLALVQTISQLQKGNRSKGRKPLDKTQTGAALNDLKRRITVIDLTEADVDNGILTNNISDFACYTRIKKLNPRYLGTIKQRIR